mgnify:CR=1 FL=1
MSTGIAITKYWDAWDQVITGGSVVLDSNDLRATCTATAGSQRAYMRKYLPARAGERVTFSFLGRRISGEPQASIDYPTTGSSKAVVDIDSDDLIEYTLEFIVPYTTNEAVDYMQCTAGVFTTPAGSCEIINPRIEVSNSSSGFVRAWCLGLVEMARAAGATTAALNTKFVNCGVRGLSWDSSTKILTVSTLTSPNLSLGIRPILSAEFTNDILPLFIAKAGSYNPTAGTFEVQFYNGTSTAIDINNALTDGQTAFLSIWAMGI